MKKLIYADNAATTQLDIKVLETMKPYLTNEYGNASQVYSFARKGKKALKKARSIIAECINAEPDEIYFTSGGTESDNWALKGTMFVYGDKRELITSQIEHHAILYSAAAVERMGYPVIYLPVNSEGIILPETLEQYITNNTKLVSIMLSNNEVGSIEPIQQLVNIAHEHGALFHTDAVQALGHIKIDVKELGVDMLSASAHKFNGPKGIGFLYIKKGTKISSFLDGGAQEFGMRAGTENIASIIGMATALKENCDKLEQHKEHICCLENCILSELSASGIEYIRNGSNERVPGNLSLSFYNCEGEMILHRLDLMGICVSTGSACDSKNTQISHVLKAMKIPEEYAKGTIRVSLGKHNSIDDALAIAHALIRIIRK